LYDNFFLNERPEQMKREKLPADDDEVWFYSESPNPHRRTLNNSICTIISRKELPVNHPAYNNYTEHIAVKIRFPYKFDDSRHNGAKSWADLNEIHLIKTKK